MIGAASVGSGQILDTSEVAQLCHCGHSRGDHSTGLCQVCAASVTVASDCRRFIDAADVISAEVAQQQAAQRKAARTNARDFAERALSWHLQALHANQAVSDLLIEKVRGASGHEPDVLDKLWTLLMCPGRV